MNASNSKYCNLLTTGEGFVVDIYTDTTRWGENILACHIKALHGPRENAECLDYDARVVGKQAEDLVRKAQNAVTAGCEVLISFKAGLRWFNIIKHGDGHPRAGQFDIFQKARLLFVHWMDVDGVRVYTAEPDSSRNAHTEDVLDHRDPSNAQISKLADAGVELPALTASV